MKTILLSLIKLYQKTLSPDHGVASKIFKHGFCRFQPTCSEYALGAISKYGVIVGGFASFWRTLRCNPFSQGGIDKVGVEKEIKKQAMFGFISVICILLILLLLAKILSLL